MENEMNHRQTDFFMHNFGMELVLLLILILFVLFLIIYAYQQTRSLKGLTEPEQKVLSYPKNEILSILRQQRQPIW